MKKTFKLLSLLLTITLGATMVSCSDNDDPTNTITLNIPAAASVIASTNLSDNSVAVYPGPDVSIQAETYASTLTITLNHLQYDSQLQTISFTFPPLKMDITTGGWRCNHPEAIAVNTGYGTATITNLEVQCNMRATGDQNFTSLRFDIDGTHHVALIFRNQQFIGTTTSENIYDPADDPFSTTSPQYMVVLNDDHTACDVHIVRAQFLAAMPGNLGEMVFAGIPVTFNSNGYSFATDTSGLDPMIDGVAYPNYHIVSCAGTVDSGKMLNMTFDCRGTREVNMGGQTQTVEMFFRRVAVAATEY